MKFEGGSILGSKLIGSTGSEIRLWCCWGWRPKGTSGQTQPWWCPWTLNSPCSSQMPLSYSFSVQGYIDALYHGAVFIWNIQFILHQILNCFMIIKIKIFMMIKIQSSGVSKKLLGAVHILSHLFLSHFIPLPPESSTIIYEVTPPP